MTEFIGSAYQSEITVAATALDPDAVGAEWLAGRESTAFNEDDIAVLFVAPALAGYASAGLSSEGAIEWYSAGASAPGAVALPGISRMYLAQTLQGPSYVLVFHPEGKDCATKQTVYSAGGANADSIVVGGVGAYRASEPSDVRFCAKLAADGTLTAYIKAVNRPQDVRLFERATSSTVAQNVLLTTVAAGATVEIKFTAAPGFRPWEEIKAKGWTSALVGYSFPVPPATVRAADSTVAFRDTEFGGAGTVTVRTSIKGNPSNTPTPAQVTLLRLRDKKVARVGWAGADGVATFTSLDTKNQQFVALAEYPTNPEDPEAEGYMRPVAGVSKLEVS